MTRQSPKQVADELKKQNKIYGDGDDQLGGSAPDPSADDDVEEAIEDVIGNVPDETKPYSLAKEVEEDEVARRSKPIQDYDEDAE